MTVEKDLEENIISTEKSNFSLINKRLVNENLKKNIGANESMSADEDEYINLSNRNTKSKTGKKTKKKITSIIKSKQLIINALLQTKMNFFAMRI